MKEVAPPEDSVIEDLWRELVKRYQFPVLHATTAGRVCVHPNSTSSMEFQGPDLKTALLKAVRNEP